MDMTDMLVMSAVVKDARSTSYKGRKSYFFLGKEKKIKNPKYPSHDGYDNNKEEDSFRKPRL